MKTRPRSAKRFEILTFIQEFIGNNSWPPSIREIGEGVGLSSSSTVLGHLRQLEAEGHIRRGPGQRCIAVLNIGTMQ